MSVITVIGNLIPGYGFKTQPGLNITHTHTQSMVKACKSNPLDNIVYNILLQDMIVSSNVALNGRTKSRTFLLWVPPLLTSQILAHEVLHCHVESSSFGKLLFFVNLHLENLHSAILSLKYGSE